MITTFIDTQNVHKVDRYTYIYSTLGYSMKRIPTVQLSNGVRVGNYSSPHNFEFEDGRILHAVTTRRSERLKVDFKESNSHSMVGIRNALIINTELDFGLTPELRKDVEKILEEWRTKDKYGREYDVLLVPLPMLVAIKNEKPDLSIIMDTPFRSIRMVSRTEKKVRIDQFCV